MDARAVHRLIISISLVVTALASILAFVGWNEDVSPAGGDCDTAADCAGVLPQLCQRCANGQTACAHWVCAQRVCRVKVCAQPLAQEDAAPRADSPSPADEPLPPTGEPVPFGEGMTRVEFLGGAELRVPPEARAAHVRGMALAKCIIGLDGRISGCRMIKPLPYVEKAILENLVTRRYKPVLFRGRPVAVSYVFIVLFTDSPVAKISP